MSSRQPSGAWALRAEYSQFAQYPDPQLLIVDSIEPNAYSFPEIGSQHQLPYMFVFDVGSLKPEVDDDSLAGLLAHEVGHLLFRHGANNRGPALGRYYFATQSDDRLGFLEAENSEAKALATEWITYADKVGPYSLPGLNSIGVPSYRSIGGLAPYPDMIRLEVENDVTRIASDPRCAHVVGLRAQFSAILRASRSPVDYQLELDAAGLAQLSALTIDLRTALEACFADKRSGLIEELVKQSGDPSFIIEQRVTDEERSVFEAAPNIMTAIFATTDFLKSKMQHTEADPRYKLLHHYSYEKQADDLSVKILRRMNLDPNGNAKALLSTLTPDAANKCKSLIASGTIPGYGILNMAHHGMCYRIYHIQRMADFLEANPATTVATP